MKQLLYIGSLSVLLLVACGDESIATITPDEFKKLEQGMSLDEVEEIVGGKSKIQKQKKMKTYDCFRL